MMTRLANTGFTLLELLVAIAVFAVLAIMSYGTLSNVLLAQAQTREAAEQLTRAQKAMLYIERDLLQIVNRPIRDVDGFDQPAVLGKEFEKWFEFTRTGHPNPNLAPRSYLQRVAYVMPADEENKLYRYVWPSLDRPNNLDEAEPYKLLLLDDVEEMRVEFYDNTEEHEPHDSWTAQTNQAGTPVYDAMPRAIKVVLKLKSMGEIWRLLEIPGT